MKLPALCLPACLLMAAAGASGGDIVYVSSGSADAAFTQALNADFGASGYQTADFSAGDTIFNSSNSFIFIEGGDAASSAFNAFFTPAELTAEQNWVDEGGRLYINGVTTQPLDVGFGIDLASDASTTGAAIGLASPIFSSQTGASWIGSDFSDAAADGPSLAGIIAAGDGGYALAYAGKGSGYFMVGGLVAPDSWTPQPQGANLLDHVIGSEANAVAPAGPGAPPVPDRGAAVLMLAIALAACFGLAALLRPLAD